MPGEDKKIANMHTIKPERKENFDNFNKAEYDQKLASKEQQYQDCLEYIDRLQKEIKRYQSIVPLEALDTRVATTDLIDDIPSHKESIGEYIEFITHSPLMQAYEQNILSLERDLENKEDNYLNLKMEFEKSMEENEQLRDMLVHKTKELNRAIEGQGIIPLPNETDRERARRLGGTSDEMLQLIETMKNDQEALIDQIESLKIRNENLEKFAEEKENRFHDLQGTAEEANNQYFKMKQEFDKLKHLYDSVNNEFSILESKLEKESREKDELLYKNKKMEAEINQMNKHLEHLKSSYNELSDNKSSEIDALSRELSDCDLREREFKGRIEILEKTKFDIEEELRLTKRDLASTKSDCNNMLKMMEDYETEIELHKKKSKQLDVLADDYKKRTEEAQMEKDRYSLKEQQLVSKINKLEEDNRYDAREREDKFNSLLENLRTKQKIVLDERENEIIDLNKKYSESSSQAEKLRTENDRLRSDVVKLEKALLDFQQELNRK
jgi:chromosome segregation ATPase